MLFNSLQFAIFFPIVTLLYFLLPHRLRVPLLLVASSVFYMAFVPKYILILATLILIDYAAGLWIDGAEGHRRKVFLILSLCANIGMLGFFKYFNFLNANVAAIAQFLGWRYSIENLRIILPIGLSFHTFQSMSYTIEVYRRRFAAERSLLHFATYVMFYPQLVAGPIERPQNLLHQFREEHSADWSRFLQGARLMISGLVLKVVIADRVAALVNAVYAKPQSFSGAQLFVATGFFAVQIYCDFCGYTQIARGAARIMGFHLMVNFNRPYLATSIADFWRRWHISLSTWFRDYLYFPLGGNRLSTLRTCANLAVVFLISGLWHGANWTFIAWGAIHAVVMVGYVLTTGVRGRATEIVGHAAMNAIGWFTTLLVVIVAWVFFRATNVTDAVFVVATICHGIIPAAGTNLHPGIATAEFGIALALIGLLIGSEVLTQRASADIWAIVDARPRWMRWSLYYAAVLGLAALLLLSPEHAPQPFIYFQF